MSSGGETMTSEESRKISRIALRGALRGRNSGQPAGAGKHRIPSQGESTGGRHTGQATGKDGNQNDDANDTHPSTSTTLSECCMSGSLMAWASLRSGMASSTTDEDSTCQPRTEQRKEHGPRNHLARLMGFLSHISSCSKPVRHQAPTRSDKAQPCRRCLRCQVGWYRQASRRRLARELIR